MSEATASSGRSSPATTTTRRSRSPGASSPRSTRKPLKSRGEASRMPTNREARTSRLTGCAPSGSLSGNRGAPHPAPAARRRSWPRCSRSLDSSAAVQAPDRPAISRPGRRGGRPVKIRLPKAVRPRYFVTQTPKPHGRLTSRQCHDRYRAPSRETLRCPSGGLLCPSSPVKQDHRYPWRVRGAERGQVVRRRHST